MVLPQLYLDTTVPSALLDDRAPERQELTRLFWEERLSDFTPVVSIVTIGEIRNTPDVARSQALEDLVSDFDLLPLGEEARRLSEIYIRRGIFTRKQRADSQHLAIASANRIRYLVSWNFKHLVKLSTRKEANLVNMLLGYDSIEIVVPPEL